MVQTLMLVSRKMMNLQEYITIGHIEAMNKVIVLTGSIVGCAYLMRVAVGDGGWLREGECGLWCRSSAGNSPK